MQESLKAGRTEREKGTKEDRKGEGRNEGRKEAGRHECHSLQKQMTELLQFFCVCVGLHKKFRECLAEHERSIRIVWVQSSAGVPTCPEGSLGMKMMKHNLRRLRASHAGSRR